MPLVTQVLGNGQLVVQAGSLKDDPNQATDLGDLAPQVATEYRRLTVLWPDQCGKDAKQRRFAPPVGTDKRENLPGSDRKFQVPQCRA